MDEETVLVVGAGAWGTALASVCARAGRRALLWDSDVASMRAMQSSRRHPRFATDRDLEPLVVPLPELNALPALGAVIMVVPFQAMRAALGTVLQHLPAPPAIVCASKGFEISSGMMAHEIVADVCGAGIPFAQLSGPNFAAEVMSGSPAAITVAATTMALGQRLVAAMHGPAFRPYYTDDVIGVEVGGALKNVIAIAAGIADGLALGANTRAALITRGLAEIARFGIARGGRMETFMGLSGMGDLVLTCTDDQSRNRLFGMALAQSGSVGLAEASVGALVEGVPTAHAIARMAGESRIEMPIVNEVAQVLAGRTSPLEAVRRLLAREPTRETL
jgi:glycerol-3-phosphate dehydrogenase (NAD(P)+)